MGCNKMMKANRKNLQDVLNIFLLAVNICCIAGQTEQDFQNTPTMNCPLEERFDYIVVGAGSAGAIVASRLSEDPTVSVLLLEAGKTPTYTSHIPLEMNSLFGTDQQWIYIQENMKGIATIAGKALGGSSTVNGMMYTRGHRENYDKWAQKVQDVAWSFKRVLPYFLKLEDYQIPQRIYDERYHHQGGPITASWPSFKTPLADAFLEAGMELRYPLVDNNAESRPGFTFPPASIKNGMRCSTYTAYLLPARNRTNLHIITEAFVTKIILDETTMTATGVTFNLTNVNKMCSASANREIVLSAGVFQTPKLLMLSGIGPRPTLDKFKIPVVAEVPGVGQNLVDHVGFAKLRFSLEEPVAFNIDRYYSAEYIDLYNRTKTGPFTSTNRAEGIAFLKYGRFIDLELMQVSDTIPVYDDDSFPKGKDGVTLLVILLQPRSTGYVSLRSSDPYENPIIDFKYLENKDDVRTIIYGIKQAEKLINTASFRRYGAKLVSYGNCENLASGSYPYYECLAKAYQMPFYHGISTCKMAAKHDPMGVVDSKLKVRQVKRLRVADASIMPAPVSAHTNVPTMMIGEKAADLIRSDWK